MRAHTHTLLFLLCLPLFIDGVGEANPGPSPGPAADKVALVIVSALPWLESDACPDASALVTMSSVLSACCARAEIVGESFTARLASPSVAAAGSCAASGLLSAGDSAVQSVRGGVYVYVYVCVWLCVCARACVCVCVRVCVRVLSMPYCIEGVVFGARLIPL